MVNVYSNIVHISDVQLSNNYYYPFLIFQEIGHIILIMAENFRGHCNLLCLQSCLELQKKRDSPIIFFYDMDYSNLYIYIVLDDY